MSVRRSLRWTVVAAAVALGVQGSSAQSWRAAALESFDTAWTTINDTFYDPGFGGLDWRAIHRELRPLVAGAASPQDARSVISGMLARLNRSHFALLSSSAVDALPGPASVPIDIRLAAETVLITRVTGPPAAQAGLAPGLALVSVDGQSVADLVRQAEGPDARTRAFDAWRRVNRLLHGPLGSMPTVRVRSAQGVDRDTRVERTLGEGEAVSLGNLPPLRVQFERRELKSPGGRRAGLIAFSVWMPGVSAPLASAVDEFRQHDGIIIDLRGNPGGLAAMMSGVAGHFIAEPVVLGTMRTREANLSFRVNPRLSTDDGRRVDVFRGALAILVDELTGSTSETFAGALQSLGRARVFGRQTMGQALPALTKQLPMGDVLIYAIGDFLTADGKGLEGVGVVPDLSIPLSVGALATGRDEAVEAALRWLDARK